MKALEVQLCSISGIPCLEIPPEFMWELLEHLAMHRVTTVYDYDTCCLTAYFLDCDREEAQRVVDEWSESCGLLCTPQRSSRDGLVALRGLANRGSSAAGRIDQGVR